MSLLASEAAGGLVERIGAYGAVSHMTVRVTWRGCGRRGPAGGVSHLPGSVVEGCTYVVGGRQSLYRRAISTWLVPHIGGLDVRQLTPATVAELVEKLRTSGSRTGKPLSARSTQIAVGILDSATSWATRNDLLGRDPLIGYRRPKVSSPVMKSWSSDEARRFLAATFDDRLGVLWALLLTRGLRRGELCGIQWDDVDLDGAKVRIVPTRVLVDGRPEEPLPKTDAGRRTIPLDPTLVARMRRHREVQEYERRSRRIRLHDCRHSAATLMLADGVPVKTVADLLGHDPRITLAT